MSGNNLIRRAGLLVDFVAVAALAALAADFQLQMIYAVLHSPALAAFLIRYSIPSFESSVALVLSATWLSRRYRSTIRSAFESLKRDHQSNLDQVGKDRLDLHKALDKASGVAVSVFAFCIVGLNAGWQLPFGVDSRKTILLIMAMDTFPFLLGMTWIVLRNVYRKAKI